ncbi:MAG: threonine aldolase [Streptosporangiales bacterium]|nr:threonine aldolase [Streptosporangiales bacterium]
MSGRLHDPGWRGFGSDNHAGVHPEVLEAIGRANGGHQPAYGDDAYTARLREVIRERFGAGAEAFPVFNGTGANVVALQAMTRPWEAVICPATSHINVDECGAPERMGGVKLLEVRTPDGRLTPELIAPRVWGLGDVHHVQPRVVALAETSEYGTNYTPEALAEVCAYAHDAGMFVYMDGSRLSNAAAALDVPLRALTTDAGVDLVSLGGTKNGLMFGEAVVVLNPDAALGVPYLRKGSMQLTSKMRFASAQLLALYEGDLWLRNARHANAMAVRLAEAVAAVPGVEITQPVEANAVFVRLPAGAEALSERYRFGVWDESHGEWRLMTAWDTTDDDIDTLVKDLAAL